jgi:hypothetical protein
VDCDFSNPVDYTGNPPTTTLDSFQFNHLHCNATISASLTMPATLSAETHFDSDTTYGIASMFWVIYMCFTFVIVYIAWRMGLWMFRR